MQFLAEISDAFFLIVHKTSLLIISNEEGLNNIR